MAVQIGASIPCAARIADVNAAGVSDFANDGGACWHDELSEETNTVLSNQHIMLAGWLCQMV